MNQKILEAIRRGFVKYAEVSMTSVIVDPMLDQAIAQEVAQLDLGQGQTEAEEAYGRDLAATASRIRDQQPTWQRN